VAVFLVAPFLVPPLTPSASATGPTPAPAAATTVTADALAPEPDLAALQAELAAAEQTVTSTTTAAQDAAARAVSAEVYRAQASLDVDRAHAQLRVDVRRTLTAAPVDSLPGWVFGPDPNSVGLLQEIRERSVLRRSDEVTDTRAALARLDATTRASAGQRDDATTKAGTAVLAADHARRLLDDALRVHAANAAIRAQLAEQKRALDALNAALLKAVIPLQASGPNPAFTADGTPSGPLPSAVNSWPDGSRPDSSAAAQAAVLNVLETNPTNALPPGYRPTGQVLQGESSWYGPGFIGRPTSSGVPYDPERLTCAMLAVPLGTVVRVTTPSGASVNLLVNDHGPYVGTRIMDVSVRANRILNLGLGLVRIEVLTRTG
jgi:rare lipoprotein A (peptidoglycan hydrolase)